MKRVLLAALAFLALSPTYAQTSFSVRVNSSTDDAEEEQTSGAMYDNSSDLELVYDSFVTDDQLIGMRFNNVSIPQGAVITRAYIQFEVDELKANDPCNLFVFAEDNVNPTTYSTTTGDISGRNYLNDSVAWNPPAWLAVNDQGPAQQTSDLSRLVQHLVNNPGWNSGNSMAFMIKGSGTRTAESYDGEVAAAPQLNIEYLVPTTVSFQINSSSDDAEEEEGSGSMYLTSSDLELVYDSFVTDTQYVGLRFTNISVPAGAEITSAFIQFTVDETTTLDPSDLLIMIEDNISPATYSTVSGDISGRTYLPHSIHWSPAAWNNVGAAGPDQRTPDISTLVEALVNNGTWTSGGNMAFMISGRGTRIAEAWDGSTTASPQLIINYTTNVDYRLQVLHASDLEGGVEAIEDAPNFAAIVDRLEDDYSNTLILSSGDNWIPGPFFNAASEAPIEDSLRDILSDFYGLPLNNLTTERGRIDISLMNVIGFDAANFGNHEFDAGTGAVEDIILSNGSGSALTWMGAQFPYLSANLDFSANPLGSRAVANVQADTNFITDVTDPASAGNVPKIAPATIINRGGEEIGVIGATTQLLATISSPGSVSVVGSPSGNDMVQLAGILQNYIDSLTARGVDKIIVSTHLQQFALEQQLAGLLSGVDIIIAGGSDFLLADNTDMLRPGDLAAGPYPFLTADANGDPVLIVSTDGQYSYVGRLVVGFDANGKLLPFTVDENVSGAYATMPSVVSGLYGSTNPFATGSKGYYAERLTNSIKDIVVAKDGNTFGKTNHFLEGRRNFVRTEETNMGNITADANLWLARQYDPTVAVSLKNGGGIRAEIGVIDQMNAQLLPPQPNPVANKDSLAVSQLDIENTLRFNNTLKVVDTDPQGLKDLLEHGIGNWNGTSTQGRMPQVGGIRFSFDPSQAAGSRIQNLALVDSAGNVTDSVVVNGSIHGNPSRTIKVVSLNFLVDNDGDGYPFSTATTNGVDLDSTNLPTVGAANFTEVGSEQDALAEYLAALFAVNPYDEADTPPAQDERIQILSLRNDVVYTANQNFQLQLLHASDLEGGVDAIEDAPLFAAIVDTLEEEFANTLVISSGDNWIPGPFFNAASEAPIQDSLRDILSDFYGMPLNSLSTARGRIDISLMNVIGFDASCFGNHEFDATTSAVQDIVVATGNANGLGWMGAQFPYLSANLDFSTSNLSGVSTTDIEPQANFITDLMNPATASSVKKIGPATVITRGGEMIGVVGATTQLLSTISSPGSVSVIGSPGANDMNQLAGILQPYIDSLIAMGVNKIITTSHLQQFALEQQLAGLLKGVDIMVAGGSDFLLADGTDILRPGDTKQGQYPFQTTNADGEPVLIVSTDGQYSYVGRLVVEFDPNGVLITSSLDSNINGPYATIPSVITNLYGVRDPFATGTRGYYAERLTNSIKDIVVAKDGNVFGKTNHFLEGRRLYVRTEETNMGNLSADANLWMAKQYDPTVAVSLKNGGGIRAEIGFIDQMNGQLLPPQPNPVANKDSLEVSQLDIENTLRFNNGLTVVETTPAGLLALMEHGISNWDGVSTNGQMPQVGGMRFSFDPTQSAGSRIANLAIYDLNDNLVDSVVVNGQVHGDPARIIKLVSLNFLVDNDGDGYPFSTETSNPVALDASNINYTPQVTFASIGSEQNALAEYLLSFHATNPYDGAETSPALDKRIQILSLRNDSVYPSNIGIREIAGNTRVSLYPNPSTGEITVESLGGDVLREISIYNVMGVEVVSMKVEGQPQVKLVLSELPRGSYVALVRTESGYSRSTISVR